MSGNQCMCGANIPSSHYACQPCWTAIHTDLTQAADHLRHIDDKRAKRGSRSIAARNAPNANTPLPFDARVDKTLTPARNTLTTWARSIIDQHGCTRLPSTIDTVRIHKLSHELNAWLDIVDKLARGHYIATGDTRGIQAVIETLTEDLANAKAGIDLRNLADVATWIADHTEWAATKPWIVDLANDATQLRENLDALMDAPPEKIALGQCGHDAGNGQGPCPHILAAPQGDPVHRCPRCGWDHDVTKRRLELLDQADDLVVSVREAVRLMRLSGANVDQRIVYACIRHFGLQAVLTTRVPGVKKPVSVYRLGALRAAVQVMETDDDAKREVRRLMRGVA